MANTWKWIGEIDLGGTSRILSGAGDPNGVVTANPGSLYFRIDGSAGTSMYVKESGSGLTGWSSVTTSGGGGGSGFGSEYPDVLQVIAKTNLTAGNIVKIFKDTDNAIKASLADSTTDVNASGYVIDTVLAGASVNVYFDGSFTVSTGSVGLSDVGSKLYLSASTPGSISLTGNQGGLFQRIGTLIGYSSGTATVLFAPHGLTKADVKSFAIAASDITSGIFPISRGGTGVDLSATGGTSQVLRQSSLGANITVSQLAETDLSFSDVTTSNVSIVKHGFAPKAPNDATKYLDGTGNYTVPSGSGTGTVSSVAMTGDNVVYNTTVTGSPVTSTGTLSLTLKSQVKNLVFAGPASGANAAATFRALVGADLPNPSATTLGGIESITSVVHQWIDSISTSGIPHQSQPSVLDLSDGVTGTGTVVLANTPTFLGAALLPDGSSSVPGLAFSAQPNTGLYRPSSGQLSITALGVVAATFTSGGIVNVATGIQIAGAATSGNVLRGNGTNFISAALTAIDLSNGVTGSGSVVLSTSPVMVTPSLGIASATELDVTTITLDAANKDVILTRSAAATLQLGALNAASPISQILTTQGSRGGTDLNVSGGNLTITSGKGTGSSAASQINFQTPTVGSSGTTAQTQVTRVSVTSTALLPGSAGSIDIGSSGLPMGNLFAGSSNINVTDAGVGTKTQVAIFGRVGATPSTTERAIGFVFADASNATVVAGLAGIRPNSNVDFNGALGFYVSNVGTGSGAANLTALTEGARLDNLGNFSAIGTIKSGSDMLASRSATAGYTFYGSDGAKAVGRAVNDVDLFGFTGILLGSNTSGNVLRANGTHFVPAVLAEADLSFTDITTNNVSTTKHGFTPKLPNDATKFLNGTGAYTVPSRTASISYVIDGGGSVPATGSKGFVSIPVACTVTGWVILADQSGSAVVDIKRATFSGFPTTSSIAGTDKPTLSAVQKNENLGPLAGWTSTTVAAGDVIEFSLSSITTCTRVNVTLNITIP